MSFRRKIFISYLTIFLIFITLLYPVMNFLIYEIQERNLKARTEKIVQNLRAAPDFDALTQKLKDEKRSRFFQVTLLDPSGKIFYDSHQKLINEEETSDKEIVDASEKGRGYHIRFSELFGQEMAYVAIGFKFEGKRYILRAAYPYGAISSLSRDLSLTFLLLEMGILLVFCFLAWVIIHYLMRPVQQIINAIRPYQQGKEEHFPEIKLSKEIHPNDDFGRLAATLNSLSKKIEKQIAHLTEEKNEKSAILESLIEGVIAVDQNLNVIYMNKMAEVFLGMKEEELVGKGFSLAKQSLCEELIHEALNQQKLVASVIKPERKQKRFLDVVAVPAGKNRGAILVLQDKTSLHKVVEMGRDFIANASHELKTPITIIRGFAETLHDHPELSREVNLEITEKIVSNCQRMDILVKNLLTLAAIDEGLPRSRLQACDLVDLAEQAKITVLAVHPDAKIDIETRGEEPFQLLADSDLFYQAILNLLDNAVKYSKPPAEVSIQIEKRKNEFAVRISDKGLGIPQEDLDRIFERFYAVDKSHSRSLGGSGLGLSIVERIVEKHQGKIDVESTLGEGTTFIVTLPILDG